VHLAKKALFYPKKRLVKQITIVDKEEKDKEKSNKKSQQKGKGKDREVLITYNRPLKLKEYLALSEMIEIHHLSYVNDYSSTFIDMNNLYLSNLDLQRTILFKLVKLNLISVEDRNNILSKLYENIHFFNPIDFKTFMQNVKQYYLQNFKRLRYLLWFNQLKYSKPFLSNLITLVEEIYKKKIVFNIVNLKKMHLNSDIYTQVVALKLRNRDNRLYRVLKASFRKAKLPEINRVSEKFHKLNKDELLVNSIRNDNVTSMFNNEANDPLNNLLSKLFPSATGLKIKNVKKTRFNERNISLSNYILKTLKHLNLRGIRVEAKGRITRRFTAARSVFKVKFKGGLKNVDSSFKGLSAIMLRGYAKSNVQYSFISSKNRNGAYGVKG